MAGATSSSWPSVSPHCGCAVVTSGQQIAALVQQAMVATAQQDEVRNAGNAAGGPVPYVVGIADPGHAARELAMFVPGAERSTDRRRNRAGLPADVERCPALVVDHRHHRRVVAKAPPSPDRCLAKRRRTARRRRPWPLERNGAARPRSRAWRPGSVPAPWRRRSPAGHGGAHQRQSGQRPGDP